MFSERIHMEDEIVSQVKLDYQGNGKAKRRVNRRKMAVYLPMVILCSR